jgi:Mn-dependent DtxR family transcriptional regulator
VKAGSVAAGAQCRHWNRGTEEEKRVTIEDIRSQINLESGTVETAGLTDDQAYELFEHACAEDFAAGLKLYKLYVQRAAFQPLAP